MISQVRGGTRWKRFALVMVPSIAATAAVGVGLAQGALAASFSVSGQDFKVSADQLVGDNLIQYGSVAEGATLGDPNKKTKHPVTISGFSRAEITNMCQSLVTPVPGLGAITLQLHTGNKGKPAVAENIYLDVAELDADAKFEQLDIGVAVGDGSHATKPVPGTVADGGLFSQRAKKATLTNVRQKAWATTAGTFTLPDLKLRLLSGDKPCYQDEK
ncbi:MULTISPECIES: DUF6230 family protein [Streptomyces]|uniref:DUF6230 family protein n=1 Tax=Streptomyces katrae TaxID=68223 RepID=A0ABT7GM04_9ACTN|nr:MULTISPECIES: DUF6230 family protein [Streptomyces]MDK9494620.1 DUF6230 family protein [Streptomyces katrae]RST04152.1 cholesterol esterase [Streptomyces sp. WAC07149]GLX20446.1 cholesterol esterase [Streptomyces lavendulae subsp. lavendulae]GLX26855.1 cholesterol esterase [Streptomyces lavendulae subsp. lavendulae]